MQAFGPTYGEKQIGTGVVTLVDGITTSRFVYVSAKLTNAGDLLVQEKHLAGTGAGFRIQPTEVPVKLDLGYDNSRYVISASTNGNTVSYMGTEA